MFAVLLLPVPPLGGSLPFTPFGGGRLGGALSVPYIRLASFCAFLFGAAPVQQAHFRPKIF